MHLTHSDLAQLQSALQLLLSPLGHESVDQWRAAGCAAISELLGADKSTFMLVGAGAPPIYEMNTEPGTLQAYLDYYHALVPRAPRNGSGISVGIEERVVEDLSAYHRGEYYNDFVVRYRMHHVMTCVAYHGALEYGAMSFHHDRPGSRSFGDRELAILGLLVPAFRAGVDSVLQLHAARAGLDALLDSLPGGMLLFDRAARLLHANPAWLRMLERDGEAERLHSGVEQIVRTLCTLRHRGGAGTDVLEPPAREVLTAEARYRLRGCYADPLLPGAGELLLVAVERLTPEFPSAEGLRERFGLTRKQAAVALLIARGRSPAEIAAELCISLHTARRHIEAVQQKLGVHSRAEAAAHLLVR